MIPPPDRAILSAAAPAPAETSAYGPEDHQIYETYLPADAPTAWLVLVHGGFWRAEWDRTHLRATAAGLADRGYAVALPEYRRSGMPGGTWPAPGEDLAGALAAVREDEGLPEAVALVGHSAGGHLAVWLLHRPQAQGVLGAVSLAGCVDLRMVGRLGLDDGAVDDLFGDGSWEQEEHLGADPMDLGPTPVPVHLLHGRDDTLVPLAVSESWMTRCGTVGRDSLTVLDGAGHFDLIDPDSWAWPMVLQRLSVVTGAPA